jgi:peptide/nickel transport system substrate-binding protein
VYLNEGAIIYLYHSLLIIAYTARLEGYTQLPDGLVRLTGVVLKP